MKKEVLFSSKSCNWSTPQDLFNDLDRIFHFTLDVCADSTNFKCLNYYDLDTDGLKQDWSNNTCWCNPPYGRDIYKWVEKAYYESRHRNTDVVMLLPARTDTKWFHDFILPFGNIRFIKGRLKFGNSNNSAPFPSMLVHFTWSGTLLKYFVPFQSNI